MISVGIVNDLLIARVVLRRIVEQTPGFRVLWEAASGIEAAERHRAQPASIVLMDLIMPGIDGVQTTALLMSIRQCAILVVTASVSTNRQLVFAAMGKGALDAIDTPEFQSAQSVTALQRKLVTISRLVLQSQPSAMPATESVAEPTGPVVSAPSHVIHQFGRRMPIIAIGASTGGPQALANLLRRLPVEFGAAVLIVQHLDRHFVPGLQTWLQNESAMPVRLAGDGERLSTGGVWLSHTSEHMIVRMSAEGVPVLSYTPEPNDTPHRPSVDVFFQSLAALPVLRRAGILLTGMGRDGAVGLLALRQSGAQTYVQDQASCVVYGMPRAALELGAAAEPTPLLEIPEALLQWVESFHTTEPATSLEAISSPEIKPQE